MKSNSAAISSSICDGMQKTCVSSCTKRRTRVSPVSAPDASLRCRMPNSAMRMGSSLYERSRESKMRQWPGQFIGFSAHFSFSTSSVNMSSL